MIEIIVYLFKLVVDNVALSVYAILYGNKLDKFIVARLYFVCFCDLQNGSYLKEVEMTRN